MINLVCYEKARLNKADLSNISVFHSTKNSGNSQTIIYFRSLEQNCVKFWFVKKIWKKKQTIGKGSNGNRVYQI